MKLTFLVAPLLQVGLPLLHDGSRTYKSRLGSSQAGVLTGMGAGRPLVPSNTITPWRLFITGWSWPQLVGKTYGAPQTYMLRATRHRSYPEFFKELEIYLR